MSLLSLVNSAEKNIHLQDFVSTFNFNLGVELLGRKSDNSLIEYLPDSFSLA